MSIDIDKTPDVEIITSYSVIPYSLIGEEVTGTSKAEFEQELGEILKLYTQYRKGAPFILDGSNGDYVPSNVKFKKARSILDKEARFLFSITPDIKVNQDDINASKEVSIIQDFLNKVLRKNGFSLKLLKAGRDCFIGKRVACFLNFEANTGIGISFAKSTEFYYETAPTDPDILIKLVGWFRIHQSSNNSEVRIFKKKYVMISGNCWVEEVIYDGAGKQIEEVTPLRATEFLYIPAMVICNEGLTGETKGESELEQLLEYESAYSKGANGDIDAERKSMNPIRYAIDASPESTSNLSSAAGSFWDIQSDGNGAVEGSTAQVGLLESTMGYTAAVKTTLDRIENAMHELVDVPNINSEQLAGVITSGKALKTLYWGLVTRCNEKMLTWKPALERMAEMIIDGALLYPESARLYTSTPISDIEVDITVDNQYPLPEDEVEEKTMNIAELDAYAMSRKSYLKKWRNMSDQDVEEELKQIAKEKDILENSASAPPAEDTTIPEDTGDLTIPEETDTTLEADLSAFESELNG